MLMKVGISRDPFECLMGLRISQGIYDHWADLSSNLRGAHVDTGRGTAPAGAHARVRELATMTATEPETGLVFRHNAR